MIKTSIYKDVVNDYQEKLIGGLSIRKLVACGVAFPLGIFLAFILTTVWGLDVQTSGYVVVIITIPIWYLGFFRPKGMDPEKYALLWWQDTFGNNKLYYKSHASHLQEALDKCANRQYAPTKAQLKSAKKEREYLG